MKESIETIYLGGGCFWCIEAAFKQVPGILNCTSGYSGGSIANPTYEQVCSGNTGHAEVVRIEFDSSIIKLKRVLDLFFEMHDPTSLNKQGADEGTQYRSAVYTTNQEQLEEVVSYIESRQSDYSEPIVTEVKMLDKFYEAEIDHQDYFARNPEKAYCQIVIAPKVEKINKLL